MNCEALTPGRFAKGRRHHVPRGQDDPVPGRMAEAVAARMVVRRRVRAPAKRLPRAAAAAGGPPSISSPALSVFHSLAVVPANLLRLFWDLWRCF